MTVEEKEFLKGFFDANDSLRLIVQDNRDVVASRNNPYGKGMLTVAWSIYENEKYCRTESGDYLISWREHENDKDFRRLSVKSVERLAKNCIKRALFVTYEVLRQSINNDDTYRPYWNIETDIEGGSYHFLLLRMYTAQILVHNLRLQPCMEPFESYRGKDNNDNKKPLYYTDFIKQSNVYKEICNFPLRTDFNPNPPKECKRLMDYPAPIDLINVYDVDLTQMSWSKLCPDSRYFDLFLRKVLSTTTYLEKYEQIRDIYERQLAAEGKTICPKEYYLTSGKFRLRGKNYGYPVTPYDWVNNTQLNIVKKTDAIDKITKFRDITVHKIVLDGLWSTKAVLSHQQLVVDILKAIENFIDANKITHKQFIDLVGYEEIFTKTVFYNGKDEYRRLLEA